MKKKIRKLNCLLLVAVLVACMVVPAMAMDSRTGQHFSYTYSWSVTRLATRGDAFISTTTVPTYVTAHCTNFLYCSTDGKTYRSLGENTGYANVTACAYDWCKVNGITVTGTITRTVGDFYINSTYITSGAE